MVAAAFVGAGAGYLLRDSQDLEQEWAHCVDTAGGYDVQYPADWRTADVPNTCRFFDPEAFEVPVAGETPDTALTVSPGTQSYDDTVSAWIDTRFYETVLRDQTTVAGRRAFLLELVATGRGLDDRGTRTYGYVVEHPSRVPITIVTTARPGERLVHRAVVDHAAATLRLFSSSTAESAIPFAVALKRASVLAAAEAHDEGALRALMEPDFRYTFGPDVSGGATAFWRSIYDTTGTDPIETLARVLKLPYTLSQGMYVWPFAYDKTMGELTAYERELLGPLLPRLEAADPDLGYLGWRAGFRPDGRWVFFVAGD